MRKSLLYACSSFLLLAVSSLAANAEVCGPDAQKAAALAQNGDAATAIWCYGQSKKWSEIIALQGAVVPSGLARHGEGNYALVISNLALAHLETGNLQAGRRVLEQGMRQLVKSPQVVHAAYNVSKLFQDPTMRFAERQRWHFLLLEAMQQPRPNNQLADCLTANTYFGVDQGVRERKIREAHLMARTAIDRHDADMVKHWGYLRDMIQIQALALGHDLKPSQPKRKLKMVFVVVPETRLATGHPVHGNVDAKLDEADLQELLFNFRYFASAFQALTGIGWDFKIIRHTGAVTKTTYVSDPPRSVMHPIMESITPAFSALTLREIEQSDAVTLVWAGTRQPAGHLITNGSGTEYGFPIKGKSLHRLLVISDSNKRYLDGNHANSALFWFHEIFHVMEWAYYKSPFPSAEHSYALRDAWPADYQGTTEWDFYRETYLKRFMPEDSLARFEWRSNHEGFYNRKVKGK